MRGAIVFLCLGCFAEATLKPAPVAACLLFDSPVESPAEELSFDHLTDSFGSVRFTTDRTSVDDDLIFSLLVHCDQSTPDMPLIVRLGSDEPGCSCLEAIISENGPWMLKPQSGNLEPNPKSWHHLANVLYLDLDSGVGYNVQDPTDKNEVLNLNEATIDDNLQASKFCKFFRKYIKKHSDVSGPVTLVTRGSGAQTAAAIVEEFHDTEDETIAAVLLESPTVDLEAQLGAIPKTLAAKGQGVVKERCRYFWEKMKRTFSDPAKATKKYLDSYAASTLPPADDAIGRFNALDVEKDRAHARFNDLSERFFRQPRISQCFLRTTDGDYRRSRDLSPQSKLGRYSAPVDVLGLAGLTDLTLVYGTDSLLCNPIGLSKTLQLASRALGLKMKSFDQNGLQGRKGHSGGLTVVECNATGYYALREHPGLGYHLMRELLGRNA
ncbi:MAG: hypothetical protein KVP17_005137 [Porospora cf. gigantea B]|nr:MAG: hypothetical protein KVP17_005137 [Porospora cf. gigantea B]